MIVIETKSYKELSKRAADLIIDEINKNPNLVIGFATGATSLGLYSLLINSYKKKKVDLSKIISFNLDEYYPIKKSHKNSYFYYMHKNLFNYINIKKSNINLLDGETNNPNKECKEYEKKLKKHFIDIQILGVGVNGHLGFNEPGAGFNSKTRLVLLSDKTRTINSRYFENIKDMPRHALTIGISNIMKSKKIILLASGENKANAINKLINGNFDKNWPVTALKKHKNLIVIVDKDAGKLLK